jgi:16S rRNA G527 N7-methylase RsmG
MVESRTRKAAFLREVLRELGISGVVEARRFEEVAADPAHREHFPLLSIRAVRLDPVAYSTVESLLCVDGCAALFRTVDAPDPPPDMPPLLHWRWSRQLIPASHSSLTLVQKC